MSEQRDVFFKCAVCGIIGAALGLIGPLVITSHREARLRGNIEFAQQRIQQHQAVIVSLRADNLRLDSLNAEYARLSLALADSITSNAAEYEAFVPILRSADRSGLRRIGDSLLATYRANLDRYLWLIRTPSPGLDSTGHDVLDR